MTPSVCVYGLWHLGSVTAACLAAQGCRVVGLDTDPQRVRALQTGEPPVAEPGLAELLKAQLDHGRLTFTAEAAAALGGADVLWVAFDTPVDESDHANVAWVRDQLEAVRPFVRPGTLIVMAAQVPVGFARALERDWRSTDPSLCFANAPENLRLGRAIATFQNPDRVVVGLGQETDRARVEALFEPVRDRLLWMSLESAEMTKHALNSFLAVCVAFTNELARVCERVGADASQVERSLRADARVGRHAYVSPGGPIAGGTLARDVAFLGSLARLHDVSTPVLASILESNRVHAEWVRERIVEFTRGMSSPRVALLGLTYKAGTDTLRRSSAVELAEWLVKQGTQVRAYDPAIRELPAELGDVDLAGSADAVLEDADVAVLTTPWPQFKTLTVERVIERMRTPRFIDQSGFLSQLGEDARIEYVRVGKPVATGAVA